MPKSARMKRSSPKDFLGAAELGRLSGVSRATVNRYRELGLLRTIDGPRGYLFPRENVLIIRTIEKLKEHPFRFYLGVIRNAVWPELSWTDIEQMANMNTSDIHQFLLRRHLRSPGYDT